MLSALIFFMIFAGVTISIYQIYDFHYNINFGGKDKTSRTEKKGLTDLSLKAKEYSETGASPDLTQAVKDVFGRSLDHRIILAAFSQKKGQDYAEALLRRKNNIVCNGKLKILHLPFWKTNPPKKDARGMLLKVIFINCLFVLFLGGLSIYTTVYKVSEGLPLWFNDEFILMLMIYLLVLLTHAASKLDIYMHDIYMIGKLDDLCAGDDGK